MNLTKNTLLGFYRMINKILPTLPCLDGLRVRDFIVNNEIIKLAHPTIEDYQKLERHYNILNNQIEKENYIILDKSNDVVYLNHKTLSSSNITLTKKEDDESLRLFFLAPSDLLMQYYKASPQREEELS